MRIALVDVSAIYWTAWHSTPNEDVSSAYQSTIGRVHDLIGEFDSVCCCIDSAESWRKKDYPQYKANRPPKPAGSVALLESTIDKLRGMCHVFGASGYEADDVIASAANWVGEGVRDVEAVIISSDKDLLQCINSSVSVRTLNNRTIDLEAVTSGGLVPTQIPAWLALVGDSSDNLPGIDGIGDKKARALLAEFGTLESLMDAAQATHTTFQTKNGKRNKVGDALAEAESYIPSIYEVRRLATCVTSLDLNWPTMLKPIRKKEPMSKPNDESDRDPYFDRYDPSGEKAEALDEADPIALAGALGRDPAYQDPPKSDPQAPPKSNPQPVRAALVRTTEYDRQLEPTNQAEAWKLAHAAQQSGLFSFRNQEAIFMAIIAGRSYGLDSVQSLVGIHVIEGKPTLSAGLIHALCLRHPMCERFKLVESTAEHATFESIRTGNGGPTVLTYDISDAKKAGLLSKKNWQRYPKAMLRARCVAELARVDYPDSVHNTYLADELGADVVESI